MGNYTDLWKGEMLYYQVFQLGMIGMLLLFVFVTIGYALLAFGLYMISFQYFLVQRRAKKKEHHEGERHLDTHTLREASYREDKIYSFLHYVKLDLKAEKKVKLETLPEYEDAYILELKAEQRRSNEIGLLEQGTSKPELPEENITDPGESGKNGKKSKK